MEVKFRRAMEADPDCYHACDTKREYLQPKWRGKPNEAYQFVLQCERTKNWYAGLPFMVEYGFAP